jgi:hypothetical protein
MEGRNHKLHIRAKSRAGGHAGHEQPHGLNLTADEKDLVLLRDELYGGSWDDMLADLKNRLTGKPYIYKLVNRIQKDIEDIERLRAMEKEKGTNLRELIQ